PEKKAVEETKKNREPEKQPPSAASVDRSRAESSSSAAPELSPAVRRILEEEKLNPAMVAATGPANRLTKADVLKAVEERGKAKPVAEPVAKPVGKADSFPMTKTPSPRAAQSDTRFTRKKMSPLRRKIAQQLVMAQHTAAILTTVEQCART